jgi:hypothetical protein
MAAVNLDLPVREERSDTAQPVELIRASGIRPGEPVIAVGAVDAALIAALRDLGHEDVTVLDPSLERLQELRVALGDLEREVLLIETEVLTFQPRRRYGLWYDAGLFPGLKHAEERQYYVQVVQFALRPEGYLIITSAEPGSPAEQRNAGELAAHLGRQFELKGALDLRRHGRPRLCCSFQRHAPTFSFDP